MKITKKNIKASSNTSHKRPIMAAELDLEDNEGYDFEESIDDLSDTVDDIQDTIDEVEEDDIDIEMDNNITNHYIAECDSCHGIFISALVESDQDVEKISGTCPLCDKETDQYIKWIVKDI